MEGKVNPLVILFGFVAAVALVFYLESQILFPDKGIADGNVKKEGQNHAGGLKEILEDFETLKDDDLQKHHLFKYGSLEMAGTSANTKGKGYSGSTAVHLKWTAKENYGGWGKAVCRSFYFDFANDKVNFFVLYPNGKEDQLKIVLQDDDDMNNVFSEDKDDSFYSLVTVKPSPDWQLISVALKDLQDGTAGGDGKFNVAYGEGNMITFMIEFTKAAEYTNKTEWYFDHFNITTGNLPLGKDISEAPVTMAGMK